MSSAFEIDAVLNTNITPESLENEFKSILATHQHNTSTDITNVNATCTSTFTTAHNTHMNGSFLKTVIFRNADDTFISFDYECIILSPTNLTSFWNAYEKYKHTHNILIDSRLQIIIMYAALAYADEILIYNSYTTRIMNLFDYCSDIFKISAFELNIRQIQELFIMKMVISYYLHDCSIQWQVNQIINNLKELHKYDANEIGKKSIIDIMMNYIKCINVNELNKQNVIDLYTLFHKYFDINVFRYGNKNKKDDIILSKFKIKDLKIEEVYMTFVLLKRSNFIFVKNDQM